MDKVVRNGLLGVACGLFGAGTVFGAEYADEKSFDPGKIDMNEEIGDVNGAGKPADFKIIADLQKEVNAEKEAEAAEARRKEQLEKSKSLAEYMEGEWNKRLVNKFSGFTIGGLCFEKDGGELVGSDGFVCGQGIAALISEAGFGASKKEKASEKALEGAGLYVTALNNLARGVDEEIVKLGAEFAATADKATAIVAEILKTEKGKITKDTEAGDFVLGNFKLAVELGDGKIKVNGVDTGAEILGMLNTIAASGDATIGNALNSANLNDYTKSLFGVDDFSGGKVSFTQEVSKALGQKILESANFKQAAVEGVEEVVKEKAKEYDALVNERIRRLVTYTNSELTRLCDKLKSEGVSATDRLAFTQKVTGALKSVGKKSDIDALIKRELEAVKIPTKTKENAKPAATNPFDMGGLVGRPANKELTVKPKWGGKDNQTVARTNSISTPAPKAKWGVKDTN